MAKVRSTLALLRMCWGILRSERGLLVFPIVSGLLICAVGLVLVVGFTAAAATGPAASDGIREELRAGFAVAFVAFVVVGRLIATFFSGALAAGALDRLQGRDTTVAASLAKAVRHAPALLGFGLLASLVDLITLAIRDDDSGNLVIAIIRSIIAGIISAAWAFATFIAVPAIIAEHLGPVAGMRRSMALVRTTWGERVVGEAALGLLGFLASIVIFLATFALIVAVPALTAPVVAVAILAFVTSLILLSALGQIYRAALYLYAVGEATPVGFDEATLRGALHPRAAPA